MEGTEEVVGSVSHPREQQQQQLELGLPAPTFSSPPPPPPTTTTKNPDPDSPTADHDHPPPLPTAEKQQQQPFHEEEFQRLDLKEKEGESLDLAVEEEKNEKNDEEVAEEESVGVVEENGKEDAWRSDGGGSDDVDRRVVAVDDDAERKSENENENENEGLSYDKADDDDDAKKVKSIENEKEDGWSDDLHVVGVDDAKVIEIDNNNNINNNDYGWNDEGWNDFGGGDAKETENGTDGWGDYNNHFDDAWKTGENDNIVIGEESAAVAALTEEDDRSSSYQYPLRPGAEDCSFFLRTGSCKFGSNCKFNHPVKKKNQGVREKVKAREEYPENPGQIECKYYLRSGGCKFGKACRYNHSRGKTTIAPVLDLNFVGLPIRPGEKECPYYMRTGSCKYAANCRFNHPDPTSGSDPPSGYTDGASHSLQGVSQPTVASWTSSKTLNESAPYVPLPMMFPPTQGISSPSTEWNGYQAPAYQPERHMHPSTAYVMNNPTAETNVYTHHQQQMLVEEFPERPGQPECSYFLKTGDCKYRSNCKFHHPKNRILKSTPCAVTDKGLPLRPDQNICTHYSRYGICKFGPNCKFDHPTNIGNSMPSVVSGPDQTFDRARFGGSANGSEAVM